MKKIELLSPAQNKQCAIAAINYGADAVYIGASNFSARKNAGNSIDDIKEVVDYAHKFYVKVYCTINTILDNKELKEAAKLIQNLYKIGVDGIIVQDMGIIELAIKGKLPPIPIFASTQCDNRTLEKVKFFEEIGLQRVILARELSLKEIENICLNTDTEIETFIHGALCVSYSGQCYLSHSIGGRSANRGECAQPCRKTYSLIDKSGKILAKDKHLLSLKDFNASNHLEKLIEKGVSSFKIEGRLKGENYIKNVVGFYCKKLDKISLKASSGKVFFDFEPDVNKSFNRGFTDYFLEKRHNIFNFETPKSIGEKIGTITYVGKNYFEIRGKKLNPQDGIFFNGSGCLINKVVENKIYPDKMDGIKKGIDVYRNFDAEFTKKLETSKTKRKIAISFEINHQKFKVTDEDNNSVEMELPSTEFAQNTLMNEENFKKQLQKTGESDFFTEKIAVTSPPFMPVSQINLLRRDILEKLMSERLKNYKRPIQKPLKYSKYPLKEYDFRANIHNDYAKDFYAECECKITEKSLESGISSNNKPLMTTKHCLKYAFNLCGKDSELFLIDDKNQHYRLEFDCKNCCMKIFKS